MLAWLNKVIERLPLSQFPTLRFSRFVHKTIRNTRQQQIVTLTRGYDLLCCRAVPFQGRHFCRTQHVCAPLQRAPSGRSIQKKGK